MLTARLQVFYAYTYTTAGWLSLQSLALVAAPKLITTMLLDETRPASGEYSPARWELLACIRMKEGVL